MKKLMKFLVCMIIMLSFNSITYAQERIKIRKKEFKQTENGFKEAWKKVKHANFLFRQHRSGSYLKTVPLYLDALQYNSENAELNLLLGISYLRSWPKEKAIIYIQKAVELKPNVHPKAQFLLGKAYQSAGEFNKALDAFNTYKDALSPKTNPEITEILAKYITQCENGINLKKKTVRALIDNFGQNINSSYDDYSAGFSADEQTMAFTSRRPGVGHLKSAIDHLFYEDIYFSKKEGKNWGTAENADVPVNTKWHDALSSFSGDGQKMIVYKGHTKKGNLYTLTKKDDGWGYMQKLMGKVNKKNSQESSVCFNTNGTKMYFVSDRKKGTIGGKDIYMSILNPDGKKWSEPVNLGPVINTKYDEVAVFISPDESTLYYSSNNPQSIGGFDIFKSVYKDDAWSEPVNLGMPINTTVDDLFFTIDANGRDACYSSENQNGLGGFDIYSIILLGPEKPSVISREDELIAGLINPRFEAIVEKEVQISYTRMTIVKGVVTDFNTGNPIEATVELVDNATGKKEKETLSNKNSGSYMISLPSGKNYGFSVNADGYMFHSENFNVPEASGYKEIFKDIQLQPMTAGSKIILYNTFFESGKANLRPESFSELNRVALMFQKYQNLVLEISGHTDNKGSLASNKKISMARAKAVVDYLKGQGVNAANLKAVGYYYLYPVASNKTNEGRQQNRRVEAKILSN